ncbi:hypothetical protein EAS64_35000 [Trebonia kvetii]|uniref:Uncharacterized protein n=1 Tax=Trebonia kvetii TaxID=2480626 RepID=A0A6P2BNM0_9ACTN|nr:hypothetical protein [Trebonia kvetii]TVZ00594.1 hypothetical protein EAS64_35000 [Trebonia kvetii]
MAFPSSAVPPLGVTFSPQTVVRPAGPVTISAATQVRDIVSLINGMSRCLPTPPGAAQRTTAAGSP